MRHGRPTTDPKGDSIRLRVNDDMREWLFKKSEKEKKSVSEIIRDLIRDDMVNGRKYIRVPSGNEGNMP